MTAVSVVVATFNYGRYLAAAVDSILAQTYRDFDVVVVDDGSTDDTPAVMRAYAGHPSVRYLRTPHLGQPGAKNAGIRASSGRAVAFLDADDLWLPHKLERQVALLDRGDRSLGVVYCRRRTMDPEGRPIDRPERAPVRGDVLAQMFHRPFVCFSSCMVRRSVFEDVGTFDETLPMSIDYDLWLRVAMKYRFDYVDEPLVVYRTGHANLSSRRGERAECARRIIRRFLDDRGGRRLLPAPFVRRVVAEHYCDTAVAHGWSLDPRAFAWYLRAFLLRPWHLDAWKGVAVRSWREPLRLVRAAARTRASA